MELAFHLPNIFVVCTWTFIIVYIYAFDPITCGFWTKILYTFSQLASWLCTALDSSVDVISVQTASLPRVRISAEVKDFFFRNVQTVCRAHPTPFSENRVCLLEVKRPGRTVELWPPFTVEVKNALSCKSPVRPIGVDSENIYPYWLGYIA